MNSPSSHKLSLNTITQEQPSTMLDVEFISNLKYWEMFIRDNCIRATEQKDYYMIIGSCQGIILSEMNLSLELKEFLKQIQTECWELMDIEIRNSIDNLLKKVPGVQNDPLI